MVPTPSQLYKAYGYPFTPTEEDVACIFSSVKRARNILVLGVTPALVNLSLPSGVKITAVDASPAMVEQYFLPAKDREAHVSEWKDLPSVFPEPRFDAVIGDGSLNCIDLFREGPEVLRAIASVMLPDAVLSLRCYTASRVHNRTVSEVLMSAIDFKWTTSGLRFELFRSLCASEYPSINAMQLLLEAERSGYPLSRLVKLGFGPEAMWLTRYTAAFPARDQLCRLLNRVFTGVSFHTPNTELGSHTPIVTAYR